MKYYKKQDSDRIIVYYKDGNDIKKAMFHISQNLNRYMENNLIKLNNSDNKDIIGKPLVDWIFKNTDSYGIKLIKTEYEGMVGVNNAKIKNTLYSAGSNGKGGKIELEVENEINAKKFIEIPLSKNIEQTKVQEILREFNKIRNNGYELPLYYFIEKIKEPLRLELIEEKQIKTGVDLSKIVNINIQSVKYDKDNNQLAVYYNDNKIIKRLSFYLKDALTEEQKKDWTILIIVIIKI